MRKQQPRFYWSPLFNHIVVNTLQFGLSAFGKHFCWQLKDTEKNRLIKLISISIIIQECWHVSSSRRTLHPPCPTTSIMPWRWQKTAPQPLTTVASKPPVFGRYMFIVGVRHSHMSLKTLGLYLYTLIMGHKSCNMLSILNELTLQKKLQNVVTN